MPEERVVAYPLHVTGDGATSTVVAAEGIEQLIGELLFTTPGERLNRPTLGCGVMELVFDALTDELRTATQFQIQASLQQWLGSLVRVGGVSTVASGGTLEITVGYKLVDEAQWRTAVYRR